MKGLRVPAVPLLCRVPTVPGSVSCVCAFHEVVSLGFHICVSSLVPSSYPEPQEIF